MDIVIEAINASEFVVCDLTFERPNVDYQAGLAHALGKPVILIAEKDAKVHFDIEGYRIIRYADVDDLNEKFSAKLDGLVTNGSLEAT